MKIPIRLNAIFILLIFALSGCYYDKENELYPTSACGDTSVVTYSQAIAPIMVANCNACHGPSNTSGVITTNYSDLSIVALNGKLLNSVNWTGDPMPKGSPDTLSVCDRPKIKKWVEAGAPNN